MSETPGIYPDANGIPFNQSIDILIDDKGIASLTESQEKPFEQWKLTDWIENMKIWPGLYEELELKNYAHRKLAEKKNAQYKALAIHMEYHLLHRRKLESQIYSEQLFSSTPQVNLMLASHDYITRKFWPVLGWLWKPLCPDADFLWGLFEYSLCYKSFRERVRGERKSKKVVLSNLSSAIRSKQAWLENINWRLQYPLSNMLPATQSANKKDNTTPEAWLKVLKDFSKDPALHLYKLVFIQSEWQILSEGDKTLLHAYQDYVVDAWKRFREEISLSREYGFWHLQSPDYEPIWSERRGRPPKPKAIQPKTESRSRRGPTIGSKKKSM
jgi:hypothetical protein